MIEYIKDKLLRYQKFKEEYDIKEIEHKAWEKDRAIRKEDEFQEWKRQKGHD